jgi:type VI secretion system secreted protein VgrG
MLTIDQTVQLIAIMLFAGLALFAWLGWNQVQTASRLPYFALRRQRLAGGWRLILLAAILGVAALSAQFFGRQAAYAIVPPTPSATATASITPTASITAVPSITPTSSNTPIPPITATPTVTGTPVLPERITVLFRETVTPQPDALLSSLEVAARLDNFNRAIEPQASFVLPSGRLFAAFTYDFLQDGVRWSAIWYRGDQIVCLETQPWDGGSGGYGYTECEPELGWQPGSYEIQIFLGETWKVSGRFEVLDGTETPVPTMTAEPTN